MATPETGCVLAPRAWLRRKPRSRAGSPICAPPRSGRWWRRVGNGAGRRGEAGQRPSLTNRRRRRKLLDRQARAGVRETVREVAREEDRRQLRRLGQIQAGKLIKPRPQELRAG